MEKLCSVVSRLFFFGAFLMFALALIERLVNGFGYTLLRGVMMPWRLLEIAVILLIFVIALLLRQVREDLRSGARA